MASSSAHDVKNTPNRLRHRPYNPAYGMPGLTAPKFVICDHYGSTLQSAQVPLARALVAFDIKLVNRVQRFYKKRVSSTDTSRKSEALSWVEDCENIRQQWRDIESGKCQFSELYMKGKHFVPIWTQGMHIIKEVLRSKQNSSNQLKKRDDFARILTAYEDLANGLQTQIIDAADQGLFDSEYLDPIQERWMRLDETVKLHYDLCNVDYDEDVPQLFRQSLTWSEVRNLIQKADRGTKGHHKIIEIQLASRAGNAAKFDEAAGSDKFRTSISWLAFFICAVAPIPLFSLGYARSPHLRGTASDADFWFLILATLTQIQGLVVSALLEWNRERLPKWRWILPAAVAGTCSILAIPLYLYVPKEWSSFLSLVAGTTQASMISQFFLIQPLQTEF